MITMSRREVRNLFAGLLSAELTGPNGIVQSVYNFRKGDIKGESPVVVVSSDGSSFQDITFQGITPSFTLQVDVLVIYQYTDGSDPENDWTESMAEDRIDEIMTRIARIVETHKTMTGAWESISFVGKSSRMDVSIGGVDYIREYFTIQFD